ncbi:MAG: cell division protein FtsQ/DivIB [Zoogloeaceae bacterium]|nr:cell division protein FtsQ/DivIB [Zoogloeaceae bacterium]
MADHRARAERNRAAKGEGRTRARGDGGFWDRPALLDLISDLLLLGAAVAFGYALVFWFMTRPLFPLREVTVLSPPAQVTTAQIEFAARTALRGNFFLVDLETVRAAFEKLPWVRRAEVRRRWPDALELRLEEHQAVAYWTNADGEDAHLVNVFGEVFVAASNANMPAFSGPQGAAPYLLNRYQQFNRILEPIDRRVVGLRLSAREAWQLELDDGMVIVLGREQDKLPVDMRLERFVRAWPQTIEQVGIQVAVVDLRYQGGFALTPEPPPPEAKGKQ